MAGMVWYTVLRSNISTLWRPREMQQLLTSGESIRKEPLIQPFTSGRNDIVFHMTDNGQYSGSIVFRDIDQDVLEKKEECKCLEEISAIIQNRLNLERHDLSAKAKSDFLGPYVS